MSKFSLQTKLPFGKYKGLTVEAVGKFDASYLLWLNQKTDAEFDDEALAYAKPLWTGEYRQKSENMNAWAWGFGRDVRQSKDKAMTRNIRIEMDERRKAGLA